MTPEHLFFASLLVFLAALFGRLVFDPGATAYTPLTKYEWAGLILGGVGLVVFGVLSL